MARECRISCNRCPLTRSLAEKHLGRPPPSGCYDDEGIDCIELKEAGACDAFPDPDALLRCPRTCSTCAPSLRPLVVEAFGCEDALGDCRELVLAHGGCANESLRWQCAATCASCEEQRAACRRQPNETHAVSPHSATQSRRGGAIVDVDALFRRMLREGAAWRPQVLKSPPTGPWLVRFDEFISEAEAAALRSTCGTYLRSQTAGGVSSTRTSAQCWCNAQCEARDHVSAVRRRIANVSGLPLGHQEPLQLVRYAAGQLYKAHHDQNTALWAPQGPRVLTILIYLEEPARGGHTNFVEANVSVPPVARSAVVWPNVKGNDSSMANAPTRHEAAL
eukprot:259599-Prymnesium_polylepis.1